MSASEVNELIRSAAVKAAAETDDLPEPGLTSDIEWPIDAKLGKGLEGAISNTTRIGYVNGTKGWLVYRGYNCFDLAEKSTFEETTYLLLFGKLPTSAELSGFKQKLVGYREVPAEVLDILKRTMTASTHPMSALATGVSLLGMMDESANDTTVEGESEIATKLTAQLATLAGAIARIREGQPPISPDVELSHAGNFLYMMTGQRPDDTLERMMDVSLILHADHGMNASTFTSMVVNSSLSDMYSSIVAGIASLKGPLHGGANERVLYDLEEIGNPDKVTDWFQNARATKRKVMGFGHRVYKAYDPRARILGPFADLMTTKHPEYRTLYEIAVKLEEAVCSELGEEKKIFPNVDFYSGLVYKAMGIDAGMFTPIFAVSRIAGWTARTLEYLEDNRIFRPRAVYVGPTKSEYVAIEDR
ncbi:citrate synthase/methylcitrate synthase [bacterium]|nr:citrate synthase/methylcitrate synthase [bacterium]